MRRYAVVDHAFGFDMRHDDQDAEVLDYLYGNSKLPIHAFEISILDGTPTAFDGVQGPMLRGDFLYVKWRNKDTAQTYENTVDLRQLLPVNIKDHKVTFLIKGPQLYMYFISLKEQRPSDMSPVGPQRYPSFKTMTIYPNQSKL